MEWIKNIYVRWFYRFKITQTSTHKYRIAFRPPFGKDWMIPAGYIFSGKSGATRAIEDLRRHGGWLLDILDDGADY